MINNVEETKINFFDPSQYRDNDNLPYNIEKEEEDQILEGKIDPLEWKKELDRVFGDLDNIEKEIEVNRMRGTSIGKFQYDDLEECRRHILYSFALIVGAVVEGVLCWQEVVGFYC